MKTLTSIRILISLLAVNAGVLWGSPAANQAGTTGQTSTQDTPYAVVEQGANHRVWQRATYEILPSGQKVPHIHQYTELATGLNYQKNGQWVESKEEIESFPGGAIARQGQHQVIFANNLATIGAIDMQTPDGQRLRSHVLGLSYFDTASGQSVLIAEVKDSQGQLYSPNVVIYPDAFTDFKADVRYTYTRAGFEQDIVLHERPPGPETYGLNPATTKLQVLTEFINPPQPAKKQMSLKTGQGDVLDEDLDFGAMHMGRGKAFSLERGGGDIPVSKQWLKLEGRDFLVEEVAVPDLEEELQSLPAAEGASLNSAAGSVRHVVSKQRLLPALPLVQAGTNKMQLARLSLPAQGLVLDYVTFNSNQTNYTFQGDTTYYISGSYYSSGTNTFEGGTVIKFATNGSIAIATGPGPSPIINWKAGAYRPVIFTAKDDNTVGDIISGSTGNPTGYYGNPTMLTLAGFSPVVTLTGLRMSYANTAILFGGTRVNIYDAQFINCQNGLNLSGATVFVGNALFANVGTDFIFSGVSFLNAQNATFGRSAFLLNASNGGGYVGSLALTNCILANVTNLVLGGPVTTNCNNNGFYNCPPLGTGTFTKTFYPFQSVGAGNYYLTNGCAFTNAGTAGIDPTLLAALARKTTHPPLWLTNATVSVNTNLNPQAARDTQAAPDLGYHYDPIDYLVDQWAITNAALTLTNGVAIATCNEAGVQLKDGSAITSIGSPVFPNWFVRYSSVQEQPISLKGTNSGGITVLPSYISTMPSAQYRFTKFACPAGGGNHLYDYAASSYSNLLVQDCEFWSGANTLGGTNGGVLTLKNNLFARSVINASGNGSLSLSNTLAWGVSLVQLNPLSTNMWYAFNNDFDSCNIINSRLTNGYNAYLNCSGRLQPTNVNDVVQAGSLLYQSGSLGTFYQPANSPLIHKGSTTADKVGLYHYTVTTNQVVEGTNTVSIGYHYVAVDTNGIPLSMPRDGIPDYLADANGNGLDDCGETPWDIAILTQPQNLTVSSGASATFTVTAGGVPSLSYQWRFNRSYIAGATNFSYTVNPATSTNAGNYSVIVWNYNLSASLTSSNAVLTVNPLSITQQPASQTNCQGSTVSFSVTVSGLGPFIYQWQLNGINLPNNIITTVAGNGSYGCSGDGGTATNACLAYPYGVAVDASGNLFIADTDCSVIREVDPNGFITTVAGNGSWNYSGDGGAATNASLTSPCGVAVDASGNLFIADMDNNVIREVDTNGFIRTVAGNGIMNYSGDGGTATNASLAWPYGVAVDAFGSLFIADTDNQRIRKVNANGIISTVAGNGSYGYSGDGGIATNASLDWPFGIAVDASDNLFIADANNSRIREVVSAKPTLTLYNVTTNDAGNYSVIITSPYGSVTSSNAVLTIVLPPTIIAQPTNQTVAAGGGGNLQRKRHEYSSVELSVVAKRLALERRSRCNRFGYGQSDIDRRVGQ
jgi:hypothetical protein